MSMTAREIATTQARLAFIWTGMFAFVLFVLIIHPPTLDEFVKGIILTMLGYLGALVQQHSSYFFARQRPDAPVEIPPGASSKSTQKTETTIVTPPGETDDKTP